MEDADNKTVSYLSTDGEAKAHETKTSSMASMWGRFTVQDQLSMSRNVREPASLPHAALDWDPEVFPENQSTIPCPWLP